MTDNVVEKVTGGIVKVWDDAESKSGVSFSAELMVSQKGSDQVTNAQYMIAALMMVLQNPALSEQILKLVEKQLNLLVDKDEEEAEEKLSLEMFCSFLGGDMEKENGNT